jgi:Na+-driven multidrug efflux pump
MMPAWGLGNAAATMVGQALGAAKPERAEQAVWTAAKYNAIVLGVVEVLFIVFAPQIVAIYTSDPLVVPFAIDCLRIVSAGFVFFAYGLVLTQAFNGAGDTWTPTWINLGCFWLWQIPLAWLLANHFTMGPQGVFIAMTVAFSTLAVVSGVIFRQGKWKRATV